MTMTNFSALASPLLPLISLLSSDGSAALSSSDMSSKSLSSQVRTQDQYPRALHPGGFSLPPLVEDRIPIVAPASECGEAIQADAPTTRRELLLVRPPDMESLWEWLAYTKRQPDSDPSWGRVWPTALALARLVLRWMNNGGEGCSIADDEGGELVTQAAVALRASCHVAEVGCGLGVAGLAYAMAVAADAGGRRRTVTFLDREPYALQCAMSSAAANGLPTRPMTIGDDGAVASVTVRAALDDWTLSTYDEGCGDAVKNLSYRDLYLRSLDGYHNENVVLLASDIIYEPSSMESLAAKLRGLLHPTDGGYALIADPEKERTPGCRDLFVGSVRNLGGKVGIFPMPALGNDKGLGHSALCGTVTLDGDLDIDGSLAKTVLIVVNFEGAVP